MQSQSSVTSKLSDGATRAAGSLHFASGQQADPNSEVKASKSSLVKCIELSQSQPAPVSHTDRQTDRPTDRKSPAAQAQQPLCIEMLVAPLGSVLASYAQHPGLRGLLLS